MLLKNSKSTQIFKVIPLKKGFFHTYKCSFYQFCLSRSTRSQVTLLIIFFRKLLLHSSFPVGNLKMAIPFVLTELLQTKTT